MRILMLSQFYPPILGGMERHVRDLSRGLAERGHDVVVVTLWQRGGPTTFPDYEIQDGVRIYWIRGTIHRAASILYQDPNRSYAPPLPDPELMRTLHRIVVRERPQIIHAHNWLVYALLPFKKWSGARLVVTLHDYGLRCPRWTLVNGKENCTGPALVKCFNCLYDHYGLAKGGITLFGNRVMSLVEQNAVDMFLPVS